MNELHLELRPLRVDDLPTLMAIEEAVFPLPWPASVYRSEIERNPHGVYYGLDLLGGMPGGTAVATVAAAPRHLVAYAGFWVLGDEAHLMTIAVAPRWQGHGLGEWLLLALLDEMEAQGARIATLEVRVSNAKARALYEHLGFREEGRRHRYYSDNGEDALIMSTPDLASPGMRALRQEHRHYVGQRLQDWLGPESPPG